MRRRFLAVPCVCLLLVGSAFGQASSSAPVASSAAPAVANNTATASNLAFDVATIRPSAPLDPMKLQADMQAGKMPRFGAHVEGLRADYNYMTLKELIVNAYKVKEYQVTAPEWTASQRFDIAAKMPEGSTKEDAPKMLQALLAERFKLEVRHASEEHPVLGLVVGKDGPKLKESPSKPEAIDPDAPLKKGEMKMDGPDGPIRMTMHSDGSFTQNMGTKGIVTGKMDMQSKTMHIDSDTVTMEGFADMLTSVMRMSGGGDHPVLDMTGLKGNYQVSVDLSLADMMAMARAQGMNVPGGGGGSGSNSGIVEAADPSGSTIYSSVQKLGLKLEQRKAKIEQIVVEHAEKTPTEN